jgi:hypothetical protein
MAKRKTNNKNIFYVMIILLLACTFSNCDFLSDSDSQIVYVTESGTKYHTSNCSTIKRSTKYKTTKGEAKTLGYTACNVCKP